MEGQVPKSNVTARRGGSLLRHAASPALILGVLAGATACEDSATGTGWTSVRDTLPGGVSSVTHTPPAEPATTWTLVEEMRVGTVEGGRPDSFGELKGLVLLAGGGFAVFDSQAQEIRVFGRDSSHLATHGRRGEGPGEFIDANGLMVDPQGRLWVPDSRLTRMSVFDPVAGFLESFRFITFVRGWVWMGRMTGDGRIVKHDNDMLRIFDGTMTQVDSVLLPSESDEEYDPNDDPSSFEGMMAVPFYAYSPAQIGRNADMWSAEPAASHYRIVRWNPGADTTLIVTVERPPVPVTAAERDSAIADVRESLAQFRGITREMDWSKIPATKPPVTSLFESADGNLWVLVPSVDGVATYDVLAPDGAYLGSASSPDLNPVPWLDPVVQGDVWWGIVTDELDVPYVVRARIVPVG